MCPVHDRPRVLPDVGRSTEGREILPGVHREAREPEVLHEVVEDQPGQGPPGARQPLVKGRPDGDGVPRGVVPEEPRGERVNSFEPGVLQDDLPKSLSYRTFSSWTAPWSRTRRKEPTDTQSRLPSDAVPSLPPSGIASSRHNRALTS